MSTAVIGYGPGRAPVFTGDGEQYEMWELRFRAFLRLHKLHKVVESDEEILVDQNAEVYANLVQVLDDKSLNLIIRDAQNDGRKGLKILKEHYLGSSKPRIISL